MTRCLSAMRVHLAQRQSLHLQYRLCPLRADTCPWLRHRAHLGVLWYLSLAWRSNRAPEMFDIILWGEWHEVWCDQPGPCPCINWHQTVTPEALVTRTQPVAAMWRHTVASGGASGGRAVTHWPLCHLSSLGAHTALQCTPVLQSSATNKMDKMFYVFSMFMKHAVQILSKIPTGPCSSKVKYYPKY